MRVGNRKLVGNMGFKTQNRGVYGDARDQV